jgi:ABA4-like protein
MPPRLTERIFNLSNGVVLPFWLLMILFPRWRGTQRLMATPWPVALPAALYALWGLAVLRAAQPGDDGATEGQPPDLTALLQPSADGIAAGFGQPPLATLAWAHLVAFDLFTGRWVYLDSQARGIPAWQVAPALLFTLLTGPVGFLLYMGIRTIHQLRRR